MPSPGVPGSLFLRPYFHPHRALGASLPISSSLVTLAGSQGQGVAVPHSYAALPAPLSGSSQVRTVTLGGQAPVCCGPSWHLWSPWPQWSPRVLHHTSSQDIPQHLWHYPCPCSQPPGPTTCRPLGCFPGTVPIIDRDSALTWDPLRTLSTSERHSGLVLLWQSNPWTDGHSPLPAQGPQKT